VPFAARRQAVAKVLGSKSPSVVAARRLTATQTLLMPWIERLRMRSGYIRRRLNNRKQGSPKTAVDYTDTDATFILLQQNNKHAEAAE
jgi:hypothetical protein